MAGMIKKKLMTGMTNINDWYDKTPTTIMTESSCVQAPRSNSRANRVEFELMG